MTTASAIQTAERRVRGARGPRPRLPRLRAVLREQLRVTGLALRGPALLATAIVAGLTLWIALQTPGKDDGIILNAWPTQLPGIVGALFPIAVWGRDERFGPGFLWTLPVDRRRHAVIKVLAGWVWLMAGVALLVLWLLGITSASGGRALPPETLPLTTFQAVVAGPLDPASLRTVRWTPGPLIWAIPFTAATVCYLLASALALGSRHPRRWVIGAVLSYAFLSVTSHADGADLRVGWLAGASGRVLGLLLDGRYGLDAVLTARIEALGATARLTTGQPIRIWRAVPDLADWRTATLLWTGAAMLALWAAASRHRERRRA